MALRTCPKCDRDPAKTSLVRCQVSGCPMREQARSGGWGTFAVLTVAGMIVVGGATAFIGTRDTPSSSEAMETTNSSTGEGDFVSTGSSTKESWLSRLTTSRAAREEAPPPPPVAGWVITSRVASFRCDAALSTSRALICTDFDLANADFMLAEALRKARDASLARRTRRALLEQVDAAKGDRARIAALYEQALARLTS